MYLTNGTLLQGGKYKIVRFINAGGFGCTYEGIHVLLKKRIAIKEFFVKDFCNRDETTATITVGTTSKAALVEKLKAKFIEEAQAVSELKHSNIVNVYDVFEENGTAYYVMDYIDGSSLNEIIKVHGPLNEQMATKYILQVADALKSVHAKNRLHLDIKPGNIMVDEEGNAVLIDFGSSKQYDEESGENTSTLLGYTPGYAPSEQCAKNVTKFSPATDIYALGATFYKLLTGVTPLEMTLRASGEQLQPLPSAVSKNVRNAIGQAMQMNKAERPQSVEEFVKMMEVKSKPPTSQKWRLFNPRYHTLLNILLYLIAVPHVAGAITALFDGDPLLVSPTVMIFAVMSVIIVIANVNMLRGKWKGVSYWYVAVALLCMAVFSDSDYKEFFFYGTERAAISPYPPSLMEALMVLLLFTTSILLTPFVLCLKKNGKSGWNVLAETRTQNNRFKEWFSLNKIRSIAFLLSTIAIVLGLLYCRSTVVKYNEFCDLHRAEMQNTTSDTTNGTTNSSSVSRPAPAPAKPKAKPKTTHKKTTPKPDDSEEDDSYYGERY